MYTKLYFKNNQISKAINIHLPKFAPSAITTAVILTIFSVELCVARVTSQSTFPHERYQNS